MFPVTETWDLPQNPIEHTVGFSNAGASGALVRHLHGKGYRNIALIGAPSNRDTRGADRRCGDVDAVRKLKRPAGRVISFGQPPISMEQGGEAIGLLMQQWADVDAVLAVSDLSAFGVRWPSANAAAGACRSVSPSPPSADHCGDRLHRHRSRSRGTFVKGYRRGVQRQMTAI
jgi:hypothetical protein